MDNESFVINPELKLIIFGGKGGCGKTTSACATALYLGQKFKSKRFLVLSTDPAPSVGDSFDTEIGNKITGIEDNVMACELDDRMLMEDFEKQDIKVIKMFIERGTYFSKQDIEEFSSFFLPGLGEMLYIIKIASFLKSRKYDLIILDTAPTGHTMALLSIPAAMKKWLKLLDLMNEKYRFMAKQFSGKYVKDECDKFLEENMADIEMVASILKNHDKTVFVPVTIPEPMSILETKELLEDLSQHGIKVRNVLINKSTVISKECMLYACQKEKQEKHNKMIEDNFKGYDILKMPLFPVEIRGKDSLNEYARHLFRNSNLMIEPIAPIKSDNFSKSKPICLDEGTWKDVNFIICGGKGGVGKTTVAAATSIAFARKFREKKILITTTDSIQALSNIFMQDISCKQKTVGVGGVKNLDAIRIDASQLFQDFKDRFKRDIDTVFNTFVSEGMDSSYDRKVVEKLVDISPAGFEDLIAFGKILDIMVEDQYDVHILDCAASGHLLQFLELPHLVREWLNSFFRILLKYRDLGRISEVSTHLIEFSKQVRQIKKILFESRKTEFIMIGIAEEMGLREMKDLAEGIEQLNMNFNHIIMNYIRECECNFCSIKRHSQEKYLRRIKEQHHSKKLVIAPLVSYDIRGIDSLDRFSRLIYN